MTGADESWRNLTLIDQDLRALIAAELGRVVSNRTLGRLGISLRGVTPQEIASALDDDSVVNRLARLATVRNIVNQEYLVDGIREVTRAIAYQYLAEAQPLPKIITSQRAQPATQPVTTQRALPVDSERVWAEHARQVQQRRD